MAVVDSRFKLNLKIGSAVHNLPIYEGYSDFYNGMYFPLKVSTGYRYVPITPTQSELTINAGTIKDGKKYYFLTRAFTNNYSLSGGMFFRYISGGSNSMDLTNIIIVTVPNNKIGSIDISNIFFFKSIFIYATIPFCIIPKQLHSCNTS